MEPRGLALISKKQNPILIVDLVEATQLRDLQLAFHSSLDIVEELLEAHRDVPRRSLFLGLLCLAGDFAIYGFVTATSIKVLLALDGEQAPPSQDVVKKALEGGFKAYQDFCLNPFVDISASEDPRPRTAQQERALRGSVEAVLKEAFQLV